MGQKSNLLTLQKKKGKELSLQVQDSKLFLKGYTFLNKFERLLNKKNILVSKKELNFEANKLFLNISVFFRSNKTLFYRRKGFVSKIQVSDNSSLKTLFYKNFNSLNSNVLSINLVNLNNHLDRDLLNSFYKTLKGL
jgi:hypothetical protein